MSSAAGVRSSLVLLVCVAVLLALACAAAAQPDVLWLGVQDRDDVPAPAAAALESTIRVSLSRVLAPGKITVQSATRRTPEAQRVIQELGLAGRGSSDTLGDIPARTLGVALGAKATIRAWVEAIDGRIRVTTFAAAVDRRQVAIQQQEGLAPPANTAQLVSWARDIAGPISAKLAASLPELLRDAPTNAAGFARAGEQFLKDGAPMVAVLEFDRAIKDAPKEAAHYVASARAYEALGEQDRARRQVQLAVELDPNLADAHLESGRMHLLSGNLEQATGELRRAVELGAGNEARIALAAALVRSGDLKGAGEQYQAVAENDPGNMWAAQRAAEVAAALMSPDGAVAGPEGGAARREATTRQTLDAAVQQGDGAAVIRELRTVAESSGPRVTLEPTEYVKIVRLMDREMEAILEQARRDWQQMERGAMTAEQVAAVVNELHGRSDALARAAEAVAAPAALERGYRHRVLAFNLLNQSDFGLMRYLERRQTSDYDEAIIARQAATGELIRAWDLDAEGGWPTRTAAEG